MRNNPLRLPSLRSWLLGVHHDLFAIDRHVVRQESIGRLSNVEVMVLLLEDHRFFQHPGVDGVSVCREVLRALLRRRHGGASTIDMQFVRTITGYREKTFRRKFYEIVIAAILQFRYSKAEILRSYLNAAFFGSGLIGVYAASHRMFSRPPDLLNMEDAAILASMLVYPRPLKPTDAWNARVARRAEYGLALARRLEKKLQKLPGRRELK